LKRHPDRAREIERMKAEGRSPGAIAAFAMWHIKRYSAVPRSACQPVPSVSVTDRLWIGNTPAATVHAPTPNRPPRPSGRARRLP
jgi:hypothetical protein